MEEEFGNKSKLRKGGGDTVSGQPVILIHELDNGTINGMLLSTNGDGDLSARKGSSILR